MRVNVYAEEMTDRVAIIAKEVESQQFTGLRFYLELPATVAGEQYRGPFLHSPTDDDSAAVTFWGKRDLRGLLRKALGLLDAHYEAREDAVQQQGHPPAIGAEWQGGIYAGRTLDNGEVANLVLLPEEFKGNWNKATAWAEKQGGTLPTRLDLLVLLAGVRDQFRKDWYWSSDPYAGAAESAWCQYFTDGNQGSYRKDYELRARAVRRLPIQ